MSTESQPLSELATRIKQALEDFFDGLPKTPSSTTTGVPFISRLLGYEWEWPRPNQFEPGRAEAEKHIYAAIQELVKVGYMTPRGESGGVWDIPGKKEKSDGNG